MNTDRIVEIILRAKDTTANVIGQFRRRMQGVTRVVRDVTRVVVASTAAMVGMVAALGAMASRGSTVLAVQTSFVKIFGDQEVALKKLRAASYGLVTDFDLMQQANRAVTLGAIRNIDEFAELTRLAQALGDAQGIKLVEAQNRLVEGMGKANAEILQGIGLNVSMRDATEVYAASVGKSVAQLSQAERQEAFRTMAMEKARAKLNELGEAQLNAGDAVDQFVVALTNMRNEFTTMLAESPHMEAFFNGLTDIANNITAVLASQDTELLGKAFEELGRIAGNAFSIGVQKAVGGVRGFFDNMIEALLPQLSDNERKFLEASKRQRARDFEVIGGRYRPAVGGGGRDREGRGVFGTILDKIEGSLSESAELARENITVATAALAEIAAQARARTVVLGQGTGPPGGTGGGGAGAFVIPGVGHRFMPAPSIGAPGQPTAFDPSAIVGNEPWRQRARIIAGANVDGIEEAAEEFDRAGQVVTASMFSAAEAMVRGSGRIEGSIISMVTNIARSLPGVGGMAGVLIGGIGGLIGAAVGRNREAVPVRIRDIDDGAARKWQNAGQPIRITTITEVGGVEVERIERELIARSNRDEVVRYRSGSTVGAR